MITKASIKLSIFSSIKCFLICSILTSAQSTLVASGIYSSNTKSREVSIVLPDGGKIEANRIFAQDLGKGNFSWNGKIQDTKIGYLTFSKVDGKIRGTINRIGETSLSFSGTDENLIFKEAKKHTGCGGCVVKDGLPHDPRRDAVPAKSWRNGETHVIDILVVYPAAVRSEAGSTADVEAAIATAVADTNLCYRKSLVPMQLRVVHMEEVSYTPTGQLNTDLSRLEGTNDGHIDNVHTLRDQYGADLVSLLTTDSDFGGLASTMTHPTLGFESSGFNVNVWDIIGAPDYVLAHEIGHNLGCLHNREDASWTSDYDYGDFSFGKRWMVGNEGYRTVMSYDSANLAYNNRIPHFSNPDVSYEGVTTGNAGSENNAKVLTLSAPYTANFRASVVQGIVTSVYDLNIKEGATGSFKVRLAAEPTGTLSMSAAISGDQNLVLSSPPTLTFDSSNWNIFQTVVVTAVDDTNTANGTATVTLSANGVNAYQVEVNETDTGNSSSSGYMVGGVVQNELGMGMPGVTMTFSDGSGPLTTDANGSFYIELSNGWSGTITPSRMATLFRHPVSVSILFPITQSGMLWSVLDPQFCMWISMRQVLEMGRLGPMRTLIFRMLYLRSGYLPKFGLPRAHTCPEN